MRARVVRRPTRGAGQRSASEYSLLHIVPLDLCFCATTSLTADALAWMFLRFACGPRQLPRSAYQADPSTRWEGRPVCIPHLLSETRGSTRSRWPPIPLGCAAVLPRRASMSTRALLMPARSVSAHPLARLVHTQAHAHGPPSFQLSPGQLLVRVAGVSCSLSGYLMLTGDADWDMPLPGGSTFLRPRRR